MEIIESISEINNLLHNYRESGKIIGLVPTMGALHEGHATLIKSCVDECDISVVSVFVNPTQFNNPDDLKLYPRTPEKDFNLLKELGVDFVFYPSVEEMYPEPDNRQFEFGNLDKVMEGQFRPGHFNGVAQVVSKLFSIVKPHKAYFGEKDYQQLAIVTEMVKQLKMEVEIIAVPTVREKSGLAMSSRNQRLTEEQKNNASEIYRILSSSCLMMSDFQPVELTQYILDEINKVPGLRVEYFLIVDGDNLQTITSWNDSDSIIGCIAVYCGEVRLIDNIRYK